MFEDTSPSFTLKKCEKATQTEKLNWEKELIGCYISGSPLDKWQSKLINRNVNIKNILDEANAEVADKAKISLPGLIEKVKITKTKVGDQMALVKISDLSGQFEVAVFPKVYKILKNKLIPNIPLLFVGRVSDKNGEKTMVIDNIEEIK